VCASVCPSVYSSVCRQCIWCSQGVCFPLQGMCDLYEGLRHARLGHLELVSPLAPLSQILRRNLSDMSMLLCVSLLHINPWPLRTSIPPH
jgi:hypothetical protein